MQYLLTPEEYKQLNSKAEAASQSEAYLEAIIPWLRKTVTCARKAPHMGYCDDCPLAETDIAPDYLGRTNHGRCLLDHDKEFSK